MGVADWYFILNLLEASGRQIVIRVNFHAFCGYRLKAFRYGESTF